MLRLMQRVYTDMGLAYSVKLSTRPDEFMGEIPTWDRAEAALKEALATLTERGRARLEEAGRRRYVAVNPALLNG